MIRLLAWRDSAQASSYTSTKEGGQPCCISDTAAAARAPLSPSQGSTEAEAWAKPSVLTWLRSAAVAEVFSGRGAEAAAASAEATESGQSAAQ